MPDTDAAVVAPERRLPLAAANDVADIRRDHLVGIWNAASRSFARRAIRNTIWAPHLEKAQLAKPLGVLDFLPKQQLKMVLLERIELSTSPLPRECSTTELQQRTGAEGSAS